MRVYHSTRQEFGFITEQCEFLNKQNPDNTSIFVDFNGEILKVSKAFCYVQMQ